MQLNVLYIKIKNMELKNITKEEIEKQYKHETERANYKR